MDNQNIYVKTRFAKGQIQIGLIKKRSEILEPFLEKIEKYSSFSQGTIDFYDTRWVGDGSAEITLKDGTEFMCHVKQGKFNPFDFSHFEELEININESVIKEIKENMLKLINLREEMRRAIKVGSK
ncbi:hypothetical protein ACT7C3_28090 [Bacillus pacificus]